MSARSDSTVRARLLRLAKQYPGLHYREAARQLGTSVALIEYHVRSLVGAELLHTVEDQRFMRIHPVADAGVPTALHAALHTLRSDHCLHVVLHLLAQDEPQSHGAMAQALGLGKSTLSFQLKKLEAAGMVGRGGTNGRDYVLVDRDKTSDLLRAYQPTPRLRDRFAQLWSDFYGE